MRRHKYGARRVNVDGIKFASQAEANYYKQLKLLKRAGEVVDFELQPGYKRNGKKVQSITYKADFLVTYKDGRKEVIDVKGYKTPVYLLKKKMFEYRYPDLQIVEVTA